MKAAFVLILLCLEMSACASDAYPSNRSHPESDDGQQGGSETNVLTEAEILEALSWNGASIEDVIAGVAELQVAHTEVDPAALVQELDSRLRIQCEQSCEINERNSR